MQFSQQMLQNAAAFGFSTTTGNGSSAESFTVAPPGFCVYDPDTDVVRVLSEQAWLDKRINEMRVKL